MSEYRYVEFRAVDRPLTDKELAFAEKQSSRAEVSRRSFTNEYHYGSFCGDVDGMLRRGYDIFLEFSNYGERKIKLRLPGGLPFEEKLCGKYLGRNQLQWKKDPRLDSGILTLAPWYEELEPYWGFRDCLESIVKIRQQLIDGDLRALYVLWLCVAGDENNRWSEVIEPPVPDGLQDFDFGVENLFAFFDLDPLLIAAAADDPVFEGAAKSEVASIGNSSSDQLKRWLKSLKSKQAKDHLEQLLLDQTDSTKAEMLASIFKSDTNSSPSNWSSVELNRTFEALVDRSIKLREAEEVIAIKKRAAKAKRDAAKAERERKKRWDDMVKNPKKWQDEADRLVAARGTAKYKLAAEILSELGAAIGGSKGAGLAKKHAEHLVRQYPTLTQLKGSLRKQGVLD